MTTKIRILTAVALASALAAPAGAFAANHARGQAAPVRHERSTTDVNNYPLVVDCVHVTFPQCGGI